jgi:Capsule assembly protein Wzi/PAP2 superfamily
MALRWFNAFLRVGLLIVLCAGMLPNCGAQTTGAGVDGTSRETKPVEHGAASDQNNNPNNGDAAATYAVPDYSTGIGLSSFKRLGKDQLALWTFPRHWSWEDADIIVPFGMATGGLLATDSDFSRGLSNSPSRLNNSTNFSNYGIGAMIGVGGGLYMWGRLTHDEHKKETGFLAGESALNAVLIAEAMKYALGRSRPLDKPQYAGDFWHGGASMPSEHAAVAWAIAGIFAHEYPGPLTSFMAYGLASSIGLARISAKQHFPSDVLVGSVIGWYVAKQTYRAHHDPELGGTEWLPYGETGDTVGNIRNTSLGTTFVPLSSWIYPALKRLIALGYIQAQFVGIEPWSRQECANLLQEAGERIVQENDVSDEVNGLYAALRKEFATDSERLGGGAASDRTGRVESMYAQVTGISGPPLNDSYHFGQTIYDDFGRPFAEGVNAVAGGSGWVTQGRFAIYASGEYEYAPSSPTYSAAVNNAIAVMDSNPVQPGIFPSTNQFRLMDTYVSSNQMNWLLSFGKQSLWWSPDYSNAFMMSNNAAPIYMFRANREAPFEIPWVSRLLGPMKIDAFFGKLSGNQFPPRPLLHGEKFSFKPSPNLEFGFSRTAEMGGVGRPITLESIWESYTSFKNSYALTGVSPGKRTSSFDMNYRIPYLRNWLTIYTDSIATDNVTPFADLGRGGFAPGLYLTRFPKFSKLDLRLEAAYTDTPKVWIPPRVPLSANGQFIYWDLYYHDLYTNNGFLIGSPVGREGHSYQAWTTYHASSLNSIQFGYRHTSEAPDFIPGGGNINDASVRVNWWVHGNINTTALLQYETWNYPLLSAKPQTNWTSSVGVTFYPEGWKYGH